MTPNERLAEAARIRQVYLFRHQASVRNEISRLLSVLEKNVAAAISSNAPMEAQRSRYRTARMDKMIEEVLGLVSEAYRGIRSFHEGDLRQLVEAEALWLVEAVNLALSQKLVSIGDNLGDYAATVRDSLISGAPVREWWSEQSAGVQKAFAREMRIGLISGEADARLITRTRTLMDISRRRAKILVRGASSAVTAQVRRKAVLDNPRVFRGVQQVSVFDGRTSDTCIAYAGKVWSVPDFKPVGHRLPYNGGLPRHPNCRSSEIAVITEEFGGEPAEDISFEQFLSNKSPAEVNNLLGKGRAELYLKGQLSLTDLVDQNGRAMTVEQLKANLTR